MLYGATTGGQQKPPLLGPIGGVGGVWDYQQWQNQQQQQGGGQQPYAPPAAQAPPQPSRPISGQGLLPQEIGQGYQGYLDWMNQNFQNLTNPAFAPGGPLSQISSGSLWQQGNPYIQSMIDASNQVAQDQYGKAMTRAEEQYGQLGLSTASPLQQYKTQSAQDMANQQASMAAGLRSQDFWNQQQNTMTTLPMVGGFPQQTLGALGDLYGMQQQAIYGPLGGASGFFTQNSPYQPPIGMQGNPYGSSGLTNLAGSLPFMGNFSGGRTPPQIGGGSLWSGMPGETGYSGGYSAKMAPPGFSMGGKNPMMLPAGTAPPPGMPQGAFGQPMFAPPGSAPSHGALAQQQNPGSLFRQNSGFQPGRRF